MKLNKSRFWLGSILLLCLLVQPAGVGAQCDTTTAMTTGSTMGMEYRVVSRYFTTGGGGTSTVTCMFVTSNMARGCSPDAADGTVTGTFVVASAYTSVFPSLGTMDAICSWTCTCDTNPITVTKVDLPVELMEFSVGP